VVMGLFALGTVPGLLAVGGLTSAVKGAFARKFFKFAGLVILIFAMFNITNGFNLTGFNFAYGKTENLSLNDPNVTLENGVQVVRMKETGSGYSPNRFTIKQGIPVRWIIDAQAPYSCAASLSLPKYNIRKYLTAGENIIEFTPKETGRIPFSCSMGMYTGVFNVVDKNGKAPATINLNSTPTANASAGGCGRGGTATASAGGCGGGSAASGASAGSCGGGASGGGGGGCGCGGGGKPVIPSIGSVTNSPAVNNGANASGQVITSNFTVSSDIVPNTFTVNAGAPVRYVINPTEDGVGCMYAIMVPGLYNDPIPLQANQQIVMNFTPSQPGEYPITCGMGVPRGKIVVR